MAVVTKEGRLLTVAEDPWVRVSSLEEAGPGAKVWPIELYLEKRPQILALGGSRGLAIPSGRGLDEWRHLVAEVDMIFLDFEQFRDGRHYSLARRLREQLGYGGGLRACGEVVPDQLFFLARCGFDSFELSPAVATQAQNCLRPFSAVYQAAGDEAEPLWIRRLSESGGKEKLTKS